MSSRITLVFFNNRADDPTHFITLGYYEVELEILVSVGGCSESYVQQRSKRLGAIEKHLLQYLSDTAWNP